ncbi:MAG TPA: Stp1/IreP family PP2C-type Ser/Thr phosphatase [Conexibacter sp.]|nr:Stp1/IreP family PP2C-type Ser/Thr phosphatase [Conexibacter sp.]
MLRVAEHFEKSDTGRQRRVNEDAFFARAPLFVLADGMGGAQAGEVASRLAAETFAAGLPEGGTPEQRLAAQALEANRRIHEVSRKREDRAGMGTTLTAAYVDADEIALAHVGDSRAYLLRDGELTRLTRDHTLVDELVRRGKLTEEEAAEHPQRSIITRALGPEPDVEVDTLTYGAQSGDVVLLCSDGLTSMIGEPEVAAILRDADGLPAAGRALVDAANDAGGRDNITVVLLRLEDVGAGGAPPQGDTGRTGALRSEDVRSAVAEAEAATAVAAAPRRARDDRAHGPLPRRVKLMAATLATLVVLGGLGIAGWLASRAVFFVGTNDRGLVTEYRGLPWDLPAGIHLYESFYVSGVPASDVPARRRADLLDHRLRSRNDASDLISQLELGRLSP